MNESYGLGQVGGTLPQQQAEASNNQAKQCAPIPFPTPEEQLRDERVAGITLQLALDIFLQVPSMAAMEAIEQGVGAYHEAWIRGRKRVL